LTRLGAQNSDDSETYIVPDIELDIGYFDDPDWKLEKPKFVGSTIFEDRENNVDSLTDFEKSKSSDFTASDEIENRPET
jgi:hypothetical protein